MIVCRFCCSDLSVFLLFFSPSFLSFSDYSRFNLLSRIYILLSDPSSGRWAQTLSVLILTMIVVACTAFVVETLPEFHEREEGSDAGKQQHAIQR